MTNYQRLLTEPDAHRILLAEVTYFNGTNTAILRRGQVAWTSGRSDTPPDLEFLPGLTSDLNVEAGIDKGETLGGVAQPEHGLLEFANRGEFDGWKVGYSVDGYDVRLLMVGYLADGTPISYAEAAAAPLFVGVGKGRPSVSTTVMEIAVKGDLYRLDRPLATKLFSPSCPYFPGTSVGLIDYGDVLDRGAGSFTFEFWIKTDDSSIGGQLIVSKDTGSAGWYIDLGTAGAGAIRFGIREQTPATSDTSTGVIKIGQDHHVAVVWDAAAGKRYVYIDRALLVTTTVTAGVPAGNAASLQIGKGFLGAISRGRLWSAARTLQQLGDNMLVPLLGTGVSQEAGLDELLSISEGKGGLTYGSKVSSTNVGTLGVGVTWTTATWCGASLVGKRWPVIVGRVLDWQLTPIDPARNIFASSWPPPVGISAVRSNHNALTPVTQYTVDYRGLVTLAAAPGGTISADILGETMFGGAVSYDGASAYASGTVTSPSGPMALTVMFQASTTASTLRIIGGWDAASGAGRRFFYCPAGPSNYLRWECINDAGVSFFADFAGPLAKARWYVAVGVLDAVNAQLRLYVDGALRATTAITGSWTTTASGFDLARLRSGGGNFLPGSIGEVNVYGAALGITDAEALTVAPSIAGTTGLQHSWKAADGSGSSLADSVVGGTNLALSGTVTWSQARIAPADLVNVLATRYAGYGNYSVLYDGSTGYASGPVPCPSGTMSLHSWFLAASSATTHRRIAGWEPSSGAGKRQLEFAPGSFNTLQFAVSNDAGTSFLATYLTTSILPNVWPSVLGVLDVVAGALRLYVDGALVATTPITGSFNTTITAFAIGRSAAGAADYLPGGVDEVSVWNSALAAPDAVTLTKGPVGSVPGLTQAWHCDEGAGRALQNAVPGGSPLTLSGGVTWLKGGSPAGNNVTAPGIDTSSAAAYIRQTAADSGWPTDDESTVLDVADLILTGVHSYLRPDPVTRKLQMGQVALQTGVPDALADFKDGDIPAKSDVTPGDDKVIAPVYKVALFYAKNWNVMPASQLAGIVTSQPDRYQFGQTEWRTSSPAQDLTILTNYPNARELPPLETPLLNAADAAAESARVLPFYGPTLEKDQVELRTSGLGLVVGGEMRVTVVNTDGVARLGMGPPGKSYRVVRLRRVNNRATATGWRA